MAYKIEDIDGSEMPEGAVEFSLAEGGFRFTYYNISGQYKCGPMEYWAEDPKPDNRPRYKVADHHPDLKHKEWDGEGCPPVGWKGEYRPYWHACEVIAMHGDFAVVWDAHDLEYFRTKDESIFRPIRSDREDWVEKALKAIDSVDSISRKDAIEMLYDAFKSGKLKAPEVE